MLIVLSHEILGYFVTQKYIISTKGNKFKIFWARTNRACLKKDKNANVVGAWWGGESGGQFLFTAYFC